MELNRRSVLQGLLAAAVAPALVQYEAALPSGEYVVTLKEVVVPTLDKYVRFLVYETEDGRKVFSWLKADWSASKNGPWFPMEVLE